MAANESKVQRPMRMRLNVCVFEAVKRGESFVIHGPPSTGESQTVANVIADNFLGQGTNGGRSGPKHPVLIVEPAR